MSENEFELNGKVYASIAEERGICTGCAFDIGTVCGLDDKDEIPSCISSFRSDGIEVIFVEKQP